MYKSLPWAAMVCCWAAMVRWLGKQAAKNVITGVRGMVSTYIILLLYYISTDVIKNKKHFNLYVNLHIKIYARECG